MDKLIVEGPRDEPGAVEDIEILSHRLHFTSPEVTPLSLNTFTHGFSSGSIMDPIRKLLNPCSSLLFR